MALVVLVDFVVLEYARRGLTRNELLTLVSMQSRESNAAAFITQNGTYAPPHGRVEYSNGVLRVQFHSLGGTFLLRRPSSGVSLALDDSDTGLLIGYDSRGRYVEATLVAQGRCSYPTLVTMLRRMQFIMRSYRERELLVRRGGFEIDQDGWLIVYV